jgi:RNA polymerase sigma factor (sigma-70 family)
VSLTPLDRLPAPDQSRWFADEVQCHEQVLKSYLRGSFPTVRDVDDIVQESFVRVWKARLAHPIASGKSFLFQVARNLAVDNVRHKMHRIEILSGDLAALSVIEDKPNAAEVLSYRERVDVVADALAFLPNRCREILILRKFKYLPQKEVARQLGLSERTVESQLARGMMLCERYLRKRGFTTFAGDGR